MAPVGIGSLSRGRIQAQVVAGSTGQPIALGGGIGAGEAETEPPETNRGISLSGRRRAAVPPGGTRRVNPGCGRAENGLIAWTAEFAGPLQVAVVTAMVIAGLIAHKHGYEHTVPGGAIIGGISSAQGAIVILLSVGALVGTSTACARFVVSKQDTTLCMCFLTVFSVMRRRCLRGQRFGLHASLRLSIDRESVGED